MTNRYDRLREKYKKRYLSNNQRAINALREIVTAAPKLLLELEAGHHYRLKEVDQIFEAAEHLRISYIHALENDNFIKAIEYLEDDNDDIDELSQTIHPTDSKPDQ